MINIDPKHLSRIEVGKSFPSMDTLEKTAKALKVELKDFFEFAHKAASSDKLLSDINKLLKEAKEEKLSLILKIIRAVVR